MIKNENVQKNLQIISKKLGKIGSNKYLSSLRDGFALSLPLTIAGAIAILFITIIFGG
jgi:cellobiose-specific phosphotransferase system component IIC